MSCDWPSCALLLSFMLLKTVFKLQSLLFPLASMHTVYIQQSPVSRYSMLCPSDIHNYKLGPRLQCRKTLDLLLRFRQQWRQSRFEFKLGLAQIIQSDHTEGFELEGTLKIPWFQPPAMDTDTSHWNSSFWHSFTAANVTLTLYCKCIDFAEHLFGKLKVSRYPLKRHFKGVPSVFHISVWKVCSSPFSHAATHMNTHLRSLK